MKLEYHTIDSACNTKETGPYYPQITKMSKGYDFDSEQSVYNLKKLEDNINFCPNVDTFILNGKSKKTDFLSCSFLARNSFIISNSALNVLNQFNLPRHYIFKIKIQYGSQILENYQLLYLVHSGFETVIFETSKIYIEEVNSRKFIKSLPSVSKEEYFEIKKELFRRWDNDEIEYQGLYFSEISLNAPPKYDMFHINNMIDSDVYISNSLANSLAENNISGIEVIMSQKLVFRES